MSKAIKERVIVEIVFFLGSWPILSFSSIEAVSSVILRGVNLYVQRCGSTLNNQRGREPFPPFVCRFVLTQVAVGWPAAPSSFPKAPVFIETSALLASCRQEYRSYQINTVGSASPPELQPDADEASESRGFSWAFSTH